MLKNSTVINLLSDITKTNNLNNINIRKVNTFSNSDNEIVISCIKIILHTLPNELRKQFVRSQLKFKVLSKEDIKSKEILDKFEEIKCFSFFDIKVNTIFIIKPASLSKVDSAKYILHNLIHEIGHIILFYLLDSYDTKAGLRPALIEFADKTDKDGGVSDYANKYVKGEYGKNREEINGYKTKYHENFSEFYRLHIEYELDDKHNKNIDVKDYIPEKFNDSYTTFTQLLKHAY